MLVSAFFTQNGSPTTGLSPTIRIRDASDGSLVVTDASMTEVGDGFYKYDFTGYLYSTDYTIRTDGGATLDDSERYGYSVNESYSEDVASQIWSTTVSGYSVSYGEAIGLIRQIEIGKWEISGSYLTFYDDDGVTSIATFLLNDPDAPTLRTPQ